MLRIEPRCSIYPASQLLNLVLVGAALWPVHEEVKLDFVTVDSPVVIHDHGLEPGPVHDVHDLKNADWIRHQYAPLPSNMERSVPKMSPRSRAAERCSM